MGDGPERFRVRFATGDAISVRKRRSFRDRERNDIECDLPGWPPGKPFAVRGFFRKSGLVVFMVAMRILALPFVIILDALGASRRPWRTVTEIELGESEEFVRITSYEPAERRAERGCGRPGRPGPRRRRTPRPAGVSRRGRGSRAVSGRVRSRGGSSPPGTPSPRPPASSARRRPCGSARSGRPSSAPASACPGWRRSPSSPPPRR